MNLYPLPCFVSSFLKLFLDFTILSWQEELCVRFMSVTRRVNTKENLQTEPKQGNILLINIKIIGLFNEKLGILTNFCLIDRCLLPLCAVSPSTVDMGQRLVRSVGHDETQMTVMSPMLMAMDGARISKDLFREVLQCRSSRLSSDLGEIWERVR